MTNHCQTCAKPIGAYATKLGYRRCKKCRRAQPGWLAPTSDQACSTGCGSRLLESEVRKSLRRCKACRKVAPGTKHVKRSSPVVRKAIPRPNELQQFTINAAYAIAQSSTVSWWAEHPPQGFTRRAEQELPRMRTAGRKRSSSYIPTVWEHVEKRKQRQGAYSDEAAA